MTSRLTRARAGEASKLQRRGPSRCLLDAHREVLRVVTANGGSEGAIRERIANLLGVARRRVEAGLRARERVATAIEMRTIVVANDDGSGARSEVAPVEVNVLTSMPPNAFTHELAPWLVEARALAADLANAFVDHVPIAMAFSPPCWTFFGLSHQDIDRDNHQEWVLGFVVIPATHWYLTRLPSDVKEDAALREQIIHDLLTVLGTGNFRARQEIAMEGIRTERNELVSGDNRLRALSPTERGELLEAAPPTTHRGAARLSMFTPAWSTHVLEMDCTAGRANDIGILPVPRLVTALQLHGVVWAGTGVLVTYLLPEWMSSGYLSQPLPTRRRATESTLVTQLTFEHACDTAARLAGYQLDAPERASELALHRFGLGHSRQEPGDGLLDFVIALEALLLPYDREVRFADLAYRFRLHGALFIADHRRERRAIWRTLNSLYDIRSRLVHGNGYPDSKEIASAAKEASSLAARALLKAVRQGFPDAAQFNRTALDEME